ncbi:hypothetical protein [Hasllibacter sp. MH4015]|uniref:hypothetical protein n=1 Tax=Hasllibacter sp. MH4015 TaxID=2854029 RepID=UPI001CD2D92D|nr:hypothetical protein [Hasllibacter sp. MH4015]
MKWNDVTANWPSVFASLKARFPYLTDDILIAADGQRRALEVAIANEHDLSHSEAREALDDWLEGPMPSDARTHPTQDNVAMFNSRKYVPAQEDVYSDDARFGDDQTVEEPARRRA